MPPRIASFFSCTAALTSLLVPSAHAADAADPFATDALLPPRPPLGATATEEVAAACRALDVEKPLGALETVDLALCGNPQTREAWANARFQAAQLGIGQSAFLPTLDGKLALNRVESDNSRSTQRSAALTLSWLLHDFGTREANLEAARQLLAASAATMDSTVQALFLSALQAYYGAQAARAAHAAALAAEASARESFLAADTRYRVGTTTPADRLQAQTAWSQATLNRIRAEGEVRNALGVLANVMGLDANHPLRLADLPPAVVDEDNAADLAALIESARQRRPDLKAAEAQWHAARASVDAARAAGLPTVSLGVTPSWQDSSGSGGIASHGGTLGVTVNLPLFSGYATAYKVRGAQAQVEARAAQRDRLRLQVALDVWRAYQNLGTTRQALQSTADLLASAEQSERVALGRYRAGVGTILDVLNAQSALSAARQQGIQATLDWRVQRATLAQAMGTLDAGLLQTETTEKRQP